MRFLGNKESILNDIEALLQNKGLLYKQLTFFDAFAGSGSVSDYFKKYYNIIINDNLNWSVIYSRGRICASKCNFNILGFNPFDYLNSHNRMIEGYFYNNYAPTRTQRMYFTPENAGRIDFFRFQIEQWKTQNLLTYDEYCYLMASLIESVSKVSNTAGVYGAYLKSWDKRALKAIEFINVPFINEKVKTIFQYNDKIENIIEYVECDIIYLDPPYTQNQYGTQYHLLETLVLNDNPEISKITGSRSTAPMRSDWSKNYKAHILFEHIIAKTKAKYVIFSYNDDGLMSKTYIEAVLKRYGKLDTYTCKKIPYKQYKNWKSQNKDSHFEYLYFIEKKDYSQVIYESPLNYIGSKAKIVKDIKRILPSKANSSFIDVFGGGFNMGINSEFNHVIYNDINFFVTDLIKSFYTYDTYQYLLYIKKITDKFGLEKANGKAYIAARNYYNSLPEHKRDSRLLFTIILYGYQQQIRFNGSHQFNNPVGMRWFNDKVLEKMISFSRVIKEGKFTFFSEDYIKLENHIDKQSFVYMDPPYNLTTSSYNDGKRGFKGWNEVLEDELFQFANRLNKRNIYFMLSYVIQHKGHINEKFLKWIKENNYNLIELGDIIGISGSRRKEVLVVNYDI
ncbi:DNA adenine methylase [Mucispirillum schaedleri]|uniref:DNA adenine methylase n=1 Tax=Mucispirillum schaedleri TaxID=248039 RepID=UPI001F5669EB|nr:DNA adenine methylase [Mucispirillum schaedleri]